MNEFKVGDWVKNEFDGTGRVVGITRFDELVVSFVENALIHTPSRCCLPKELTKLYPKFDNFENLFSEEDREEENNKFKDRELVVTYAFDNERKLVVCDSRGCKKGYYRIHTLIWPPKQAFIMEASDCREDCVKENEIYKLNDPKILRAGDKVRTINRRYFLEPGTILNVDSIEPARFEFTLTLDDDRGYIAYIGNDLSGLELVLDE